MIYYLSYFLNLSLLSILTKLNVTMKYIFATDKSAICKKMVVFLVVFLCGILNIQAQNTVYKDNILQGVVKVKFDPSMTATLSQMQIKTKGKTLSTGITSLDRATSSIRATKMERLIPECSNAELEAKHRRAGLHLWYIVEFDQNIEINTAIKSLRTVSGVNTVEYEYLKTIPTYKVTPYIPRPVTAFSQFFNDPGLTDQWHYINTGQLGLPGNDRADVNLAPAWAVTGGRSDIIVSVHDEGIDVNHEDLKDNIWVNPKETAGNGIDDDGNGYIDDINGFNFVGLTGKIDPQTHGTHVAGTIAAVNNNGIGVSGVAGGTGQGDGVKIMSLQIIGNSITAGYIFRSYVYAADMGAVISQNSWGYPDPGVNERDVIEGIDYFINNAGDYPGSPMKGGIVIFASGNYNDNALYYPGAYEKCFSVSSIGPEWKKATYSNYAEWVNISAPGGDIDEYGLAKAGVLSTLPGSKYGYLQGTSMACPHVSGIAALALANSNKQLTNDELWQILLTSVKDIDGYDPQYVGTMGVGAIDAELAVRTNKGIAPDKITSLALRGIAQEFASLEWSVPADSDDIIPVLFHLYYSTEPLTEDNLSRAKKMEIKNALAVGEMVSVDVSDLLGTTKYYFGVASLDRWGNKSELSNIVSGTTNEGPTIDVETGSLDKSISLSANMAVSGIDTKTFQLLNKSEGLLRWEYSVGNAGHEHSTSAYSIPSYPLVSSRPKGIGTKKMKDTIPSVRGTETIEPAAVFTPISKRYTDFADVYIGDTDPLLPTSGAVKFIVNEEDGFNLTQIRADVMYTSNTGPLIIEIYKDNLNRNNLFHAQEYQPAPFDTRHYISLSEHIYLEKGTVFFVVVHVPGGNGYSLGIGPKAQPDENLDCCYYSADYGGNWTLTSNVGISQSYAWSIAAISQLPFIDDFITLDPVSGTLEGNSNITVSLTADGSTLINGTYKANVVFKSNDSKNEEYRMPVVFDISGHKPQLVYPSIVNFGSVFKGEETTLEIIFDNIGYGLVKNLNASVDNSQFVIETQFSSVEARSEAALRVKFIPTTVGNINGKLIITNGQYTYTVHLFGVGAEVPEIEVTPATQTISGITIGDEVEASITLKNKGGFPLKYFVPGFDAQGVSADWPSNYHSYGYVVRSNDTNIDASTSLVYDFRDISTTGVDITDHFIDSYYKKVAFGFDFPYYGKPQKEIFITRNGYTTFDDSSYPHNAPSLGGDLKGYISLVGYTGAVSIIGSKIYYKVESDRMIIQYNDMGVDESNKFTAQMQLFVNGDIRFYYKSIPQTGHPATNLTVLIEDIDQTDGMVIKDSYSEFILNNLTAIGLDYPGPDIITSIENGSGILSPNESKVLKVKMKTQDLAEGNIRRNVNIINNDPLQNSVSSSIVLNIVSGGVEDYEVLAGENKLVDFGVVYQGHSYSKEFSIRNKGSKTITITSLTCDNSKFTVVGDLVIEPGINQIYKVSPVTTSVTDLDDIVQINFAHGPTETVSLKALVRLVPDIIADVTPISVSMDLNERRIYPYEIENSGGSDLEVSVIGGQWFRFEETTNTPVKQHGYHVKMENSGEPSYYWLDIINTGTKLPYDAESDNDKDSYWSEIELPFTFTFYGKNYDKIKLGNTGIIALGGDPESMFFPEETIPIDDPNSAFICPLWSPGGFDLYNSPDEAGLYYQYYEDKVVISWVYFVNLFGWGQSMQAILYKDGSIKLQYKLTDGTSDGTESGIVGIQDIGEESYTLISNRSKLPLGQGLAYLIMPANTHVVAPNEKMEGNIIIESTNIYAGNFNDNLLIKSNAPASPECQKPLSINVPGMPVVDVPTEIDLGEQEIAFANYEYSYSEKQLIIKNTGTVPFRITNARMESGGQYLTQLVLVSSFFGKAWTPIENLWGPYPEQLLLPGGSFNSLVRFTPEVTGSYEDVLILSSSIGDIRIKLKGMGYVPSTINIDATPIEASFNTVDQEEDKTVEFNNIGGTYKIDYTVFVNYKRSLPETNRLERIASSSTIVSDTACLRNVSSSKENIVSVSPHSDTYNRVIQYTEDNSMNAGIGHERSTSSTAATRFIADKDGLNLSDVGAMVLLYKGEKGTVNVEVRVGGTNITNAIPMASKGVEIMYPENGITDHVFGKLNITLDEAVQILPNEEFYVIFDYSMDFRYPQAVQMSGVEEHRGRYLWFSDGEWYDMQLYFEKLNLGAGMYAAEREFKESGWVKILTPEEGTMQIGESTNADIRLMAAFAERGDQEATLVVKSKDVNSSVVKVPIFLHLNEAPIFINAPSSIITSEKEETNLLVNIEDKEGNSFTVEVIEVPDFVTSTQSVDNVAFVVAPDYGDAGSYKIVMKATDEYNAENEHVIEIHVAKTNRAPEYIGDETQLRYNIASDVERFDINTLFFDPDGDKFTFTATSLDKNVVEVYQSGSEYFIVEPKSEGITSLRFVVTDIHNASITYDLEVVVESCVNPAEIIIQKWNNVLLLNYRDDEVASYQWYKNGIAVSGATRQYYTEDSGELDFDATYFVSVIKANGEILFTTCPMTPVKRDISLNAYPNPVKSGESVKVVAQLPDLESSPLTIQIINLNGQVLKTIKSHDSETLVPMDYRTGVYLIKVANDNVDKTFNIIVQ